MEKLINLKLDTTTHAAVRKGHGKPGHDHQTSIDVAGTGSSDFPFPSADDLVKRSLKRAKKADRNKRQRDRRAGKTSGQSAESDIVADGEKSLIGLSIPTPAAVVPKGATRDSYTAGQNLLKSADGIQALMMQRQFDGLYEARFGDISAAVGWGLSNMTGKYQPVVTSLSRQLTKLRTAYEQALPKLIAELAKKNPKAPVQAVIQRAVQLLDQELARILYVLEVYADSIKQHRDGRFRGEAEALEVFFEDAFRLYTTGELHCTPTGQAPTPAQLPTSTYKVGDVFMIRFTGSGLATIPGSRGPVGAHSLQFPFDMIDFMTINFPLVGHEARHNVFHDVVGLEDEMLEVVDKAIRDAHAAGTLKFAKDEMELGKQKESTLDMVVKLMCDWLGEIDADVVGGVNFSGEAFGNNMIMSFPAMMIRSGRVSEKVNLLRTDSYYNLVEQKDGSVALVFEEHPVDYIRVYIVAATLDELGFPKPAARLRELADFAVGDNLPTEIVYRDAEGKEDLVIKFNPDDLKAVAPVVVKAIIRTPLRSQLGKSCGDLVLWTDKRQAKVNVLKDILVAGKSDLPTDQGSIMATYVGAAASEAYLDLVANGKDAVSAARQVHANALKMIAGLRGLEANQCPVVTPAVTSPAPASPLTTTAAAPAQSVSDPAAQAAPAQTVSDQTAQAAPAPAADNNKSADTK